MILKRCGQIVFFILGGVGLINLSADLTKWKEVFSFLWEQGLINWACLIIGAAGLVYLHRAKIIEWFRKDSDFGNIQEILLLSLIPFVTLLTLLPFLLFMALFMIFLDWVGLSPEWLLPQP